LLTVGEAESYSSNSTSRLINISDSIIEAVSSLESNGNFTSCIAKLCVDINKA